MYGSIVVGIPNSSNTHMLAASHHFRQVWCIVNARMRPVGSLISNAWDTSGYFGAPRDRKRKCDFYELVNFTFQAIMHRACVVWGRPAAVRCFARNLYCRSLRVPALAPPFTSQEIYVLPAPAAARAIERLSSVRRAHGVVGQPAEIQRCTQAQTRKSAP